MSCLTKVHLFLYFLITRVFAKLLFKSVFCFALWSIPRLAGVARAVTYIVCSFACSLQNPGLPHTAVQKINRSSRDIGAARRFAFFAKLSRERNIHADVTPLSFLPSFFPKKASIKPRHRSGATVHFLCQAFFFAKESGRDGSLSLPSFLSRERKRCG